MDTTLGQTHFEQNGSSDLLILSNKTPRETSPRLMGLTCHKLKFILSYPIPSSTDKIAQKPSLVPRPFPPPVFHRFQYEIRWGKAWEIWSRAMTSGRQMVDTREVVPNHYNTCFALIRLWRCEQQTVSIVCLAYALISSHWTDSTVTSQDVEISYWKR